MISVKEAKEILSAHMHRAVAKSVPLQECLGATLAAAVYAPFSVPFFDNSAMDGYAIGFDGHTDSWEVVTTIQAGESSGFTLKKGQAARIFTGAKMPDGADTVVPQELVQISNQVITCELDKIKSGDYVRLMGSQCQKGDLLLQEGMTLNAAVIGLLASAGLAKVPVYKQPTVAYMVTGNELRAAGVPLQEGEIYDANGPMLGALLGEMGVKNLLSFAAPDNKELLQQMINEALDRAEVLILCGGISVGDYDFVKECMENAGVDELFYKIRQRPGKPLFVGKRDAKWIFALPGNPASVLSCFYQYVKPCLRYLTGADDVWTPDCILPLAHDYKKVFGLTFFVKAYQDGINVKILDEQQSFNLQAFSVANCLAELEEEQGLIAAGTRLKIFKL